MPRNESIKKVLVIGSGPIIIGQAAEFDYAGSQACRVLRQEGVNVVLVNSNPATIMTDRENADEIYLEPLTVETVKRIIKKEHPDSILASLGGQTGLTIAMQLHQEGFFEKSGVRLLGTDAAAIDRAEDRSLFKETMKKLNQPVIPSEIASDLDEALRIADEIGYPVIVRPAFTLGGTGGGVAYTKDELKIIAANGLMLSPITQILVERYICGWKEIEFEVMRDAAGSVISVCSMENFDPVGVHTGDSIVIAPAVTLSDKEYQMLRTASLDIISELKIEGGCNCQFALNPVSMDYAVIEVNPRVSRSSALASKATGYPIAKVTAKIALGYNLDEILNDITGETCACFEPALDYVVIKLPKWPFDKFAGSERTLGTQMKATGEVMAIAPSFEMGIMKAVRGAEIGLQTLDRHPSGNARERLADVDDLRLFTVFEALREGVASEEIHEITHIDMWFIGKLKNLADFENAHSGKALDDEAYLTAKKLGFTDKGLESLGMKLPSCRLSAVYRMVDTCAAEFAAVTPYFYSTYDKVCESRPMRRSAKRIIVLGSGPIRIGQGIEFDYSSVCCARTLKKLGYEVVIVNNNPETVSTDFDVSDRLYFEPLNDEDVRNIIEVERPQGVVVAFGGQTAIKLTKFIVSMGVPILGTSAEGIDTAEDRERFDALLERLHIRRPRGIGVLTKKEALAAAKELGYPVLVRPSYVIGGQNMTIAYADEDVGKYMDMILAGGVENPVLVDKYLMGTELEVDVICDGSDVLIPGIMEHIERAGIHSGDSIAVYPPQNIYDKMLDEIISCSTRLALSLGTKGLVNIQYLIYENELFVIEVNPRASRTVPYISKVTGVPMVEIATRVMLGEPLAAQGYGTGLYRTPPYVAVKVPVFSFEKLLDVNASLGPEMKSTGEVLGVGKTLEEALYKGLVSAGFKLPDAYGRRGGVMLSVCDRDKPEIVRLAKTFIDLGLRIYATEGTAQEIRQLGADVVTIKKIRESSEISDLLESGCLDYIVYTGADDKPSIADYIRIHRRALQLSVACLTSLDTANALADMISGCFNAGNTELVDINHLRESRRRLTFSKMQGTGNDEIYCANFDGSITCPESLANSLSDRHYGVGGDGLVLIEGSEIADARIRVFYRDGSEGQIAGNSIRCVAKYLYDKGLVRKEEMRIETESGVRSLKVYLYNGKVRSVRVNLGKPEFSPAKIPCTLSGERIVDRAVKIGERELRITALSLGDPHCIVFTDRVDEVDIEREGALIEHAPIFPNRTNVGFVRAVNRRTLRMRTWESGGGETWSSGAAACAAVIAAIETNRCDRDADITVKLRGGDIIVCVTDEGVFMTGNASLVYEGAVEY